MGLVMNQTVILAWQPNSKWQMVWKEVSTQCQAACPFVAFCLRIDLLSPYIRGKTSPKVQFIESWHSRMDMSDNAIYLFTFRYAKTSIFENDDVADLVSEKRILNYPLHLGQGPLAYLEFNSFVLGLTDQGNLCRHSFSLFLWFKTYNCFKRILQSQVFFF